MIDAHVHAFPPMLPERITRAAQRLGQLVSAVLPKRPLLDIERAAALQVRAGAYHARAEQAATVAMLPSVMVNGGCDGTRTPRNHPIYGDISTSTTLSTRRN